MISENDIAPGPMVPAPLDRPGPTLSQFAQGLILERGIKIIRADENSAQWKYLSNKGLKSAPLEFFTSNLELKIIEFVIRDAEGMARYFLAPVARDPVLDMQVQDLQNAISKVHIDFVQDIGRLGYITEAVLYHCHQLAKQYVAVIESVTRGVRDFNLFSNDFIQSGAVTPYFEFEALVTSAVRAFETARFCLWKAFGTGGSLPSNFKRTIEKCHVPDNLNTVVSRGIATYSRLKEYRDCVQHYAHFGARLPFARIQLLNEQVWSVLAMLPDNPEVKSYAEFSYGQKLDSLSYGWELANDVVSCVCNIVSELPKREG